MLQTVKFFKSARLQIITLTLCLYLESVAQDYQLNIIGDWVQENSIYSNRLTEFLDPIFGVSYVKLTFMQHVVYYSSNPVELWRPLPYRVSHDTLTFNKESFILNFIDHNQVLFKSIKTGQQIMYYRIAPDNLVVYKVDKDTVYLTSPSLTPRYQGKFVIAFLEKSLISYPPKNDRKILVSFVLKKEGMIEEVKITSDHSRHRNKRFKKAIVKLHDYWHPATVEGRPVSTKVDLEITRTGLLSLRNINEAEKHFFSGLKRLESNLDQAVQFFTKASAIDPSNAKYYFYRAYAYYYLLNEDRMCRDLQKAKELCPFLPMEIIDDTRGWKIECVLEN